MRYLLSKKEIENRFNPREVAYAKAELKNETYKTLQLDLEYTEIDNSPAITYIVSLKNEVIDYVFSKFSISEEGKILSYKCHYCEIISRYLKPCGHILFYALSIPYLLQRNFGLLDFDEEEIQSKLDLLLDDLQKKYEEKMFLVKKQRDLDIAEKIFNIYNQNSQILLNDPVEIEVYIEQADERDLFSVSFKVGNSKYYIVKDIYDFFTSIRTQEEVQYGKFLSFVHVKDNFTKDAQIVINYFVTASRASNDYYSSRRNLIVNSLSLYNFFIQYKNHFIYLDSVKYYLSDEEIDLKLKLTKDFKFDISYRPEFVLETTDGMFVSYYNQIRKVKASSLDEQALKSFAIDHKDFSLKYIKEEFSKKVINKSLSFLEFDESIKEDFKVKDAKINVYFDYDGKKVSKKEEFIIDDEIYSLSEIEKQGLNILHLHEFKIIMSQLRFVDDLIDKDENIVLFFQYDFSCLNDICTVYLSERVKMTQIKRITKPTSNLSYDVGMLDVCFDDLGFSSDELYKIIKAMRKKLKYVKLNDNTIVDVTNEDSQKLLNTVDELGLDSRKIGQHQTVPLYQTLKLLDSDLDLVTMNTSDELKHILEEISNFKTAKYEVSPLLKDKMRNYQLEAFKWMKTLIKYYFCGILADDMGLGKSLEMISVIESDEVLMPSIIVCPKSLCYNWKREFETWTNEIEVVNIIGTGPERKNLIASIDSSKKSIYITSYDSLRNDLEYYENISFNFMILDEAQVIKNHNTLKAKSVKMIKSNLRFVLTGTPIENTVVDLWSIFDFLMPNYLFSLNQFKSDYEKNVIMNDDQTIDKLVKKITPFILRRTKKDVLTDLPDKTEEIRLATMEKAQRKVYEAELLKTKDMLSGSTNKISILSQITRLRQICVDPKMYFENYDGDSCKIDLLMELLDDFIENNHRMIIFSQFTKVFETIGSLLKKKKISYFTLTGKTSALERITMADEFNKNNKIKVFLVSLKAGGTGLNLVGADIVIHFDPWWNVSVENQATDRAYRIGQKNPVSVVKIVCENSIEQKVLELQKRKQEVIDAVIKDNDENIENLCVDDISFLFS